MEDSRAAHNVHSDNFRPHIRPWSHNVITDFQNPDRRTGRSRGNLTASGKRPARHMTISSPKSHVKKAANAYITYISYIKCLDSHNKRICVRWLKQVLICVFNRYFNVNFLLGFKRSDDRALRCECSNHCELVVFSQLLPIIFIAQFSLFCLHILLFPRTNNCQIYHLKHSAIFVQYLRNKSIQVHYIILYSFVRYSLRCSHDVLFHRMYRERYAVHDCIICVSDS